MSASEQDGADFTPGVPGEEMSTPVSEMKAVLDLGEGGRWIELLSQRDANRAGILTRTAIHVFYRHEAKAEGGHPRRWFVLARDTKKGPVGDVCLAVTPPGADLKEPRLLRESHVTGYQNRNPYPEFSIAVEKLSEAIGLEIEPNWMGTPVSDLRGPSR